MYEYDNTILDSIELPTEIDRDTLITTILMNWGGYNCRWSNPDLFKRATQAWFKSNYDNFERIITALNAEYNPIENYDRTSEHTIDTTRDNKHISTDSGTDRSEASTENKQAPFDSSSLKTTDSATSDGSTTYGKQNNLKIDDTEKETYNERTHGNIGITTSQQMVQSEIELRQYNIYQEIAQKYAIDFVYLNS